MRSESRHSGPTLPARRSGHADVGSAVYRGLAIMANIENFLSARRILQAYSTDLDVIAARRWIAEQGIGPRLPEDPAACPTAVGLKVERSAIAETIEDLRQVIAARQRLLDRLLARQTELEQARPTAHATEWQTVAT
jgi:hypothetical protein